MLHVILNEIETWPLPLRVAIDNMRTATVIIPILALLGYVYILLASLHVHTCLQPNLLNGNLGRKSLFTGTQPVPFILYIVSMDKSNPLLTYTLRLIPAVCC